MEMDPNYGTNYAGKAARRLCRTGMLPDNEPMVLKKGDTVIFFEKASKANVSTPCVVQVSAPGLAGNVLAGDKIFIDDGLLSFTVTKSNLEWVECHVDNSGWLKNFKGINLVAGQASTDTSIRSKPSSGSFLRKSDREDLALAVEMDVEWVTVSCIRNAQDVQEINAFLAKETAARGKSGKPGRVRTLAKIENKAGVDNFEGILAEADGIIVDRGYLGVEIDLACLAAIQRNLVERCLYAGKPILIANHVLERMCELPRPGRSEAADIAATVELGVDGFILSAETAVGLYPIEALQWLRRICTESEHLLHANNFVAGKLIRQQQSYGDKHVTVPISESIASSTVKCAREVNAAVVIVSTEAGGMARLIAKYRSSTAIIAGCADDTVAGQLCISYGILPHVVKHASASNGSTPSIAAAASPSPATVIQGALHLAHDLGLLQSGDKAVVASGQVDGFLDGSSTFMQVLTIGDGCAAIHPTSDEEELISEQDEQSQKSNEQD